MARGQGALIDLLKAQGIDYKLKEEDPWYKRGAKLGARGYLGYATGGLSEAGKLAWDQSHAGEHLRDLKDTVSGKTAARKQEQAAQHALGQQENEANSARDFLKGQADLGRGYIDESTGQAQGSLLEGQQGAQQALGSAYNDSSGRLADLMNGGLQRGFQTDPGYQFRQQQGEQAINRAASARGGRLGAGTLQDLMGFNQNLASQEFGNYANRQIGLTNELSGMQNQYGSNLANLYSGGGSALANLQSGAGTNKANIGVGLAGQNTSLAQSMMGAYAAPTQFAGGADQAQTNFLGGLIGLGGQIGASAVGGYMGRK